LICKYYKFVMSMRPLLFFQLIAIEIHL